jgi:glycosyltransferase involved in cell wall biosynthesis
MKEEKRVAIIGSVGIPANYGGFETLAQQLALHLGSGFDLTVYCSGPQYQHKPTNFGKAHLKYIPLKANGWQGVLYDIWSIFHAIRKNDTLLILGVTGAIVLPVIKMFRVKTIVHIDGLEWRRDKWRPLAKRFLKFSEAIAIKYADEIILDNASLLENVSQTYPERNYQLITYGSETENQGYERYFGNGLIPKEDYAMALCRIVPENSVKPILEAFRTTPELKLVFIGNWQVNSYSRAIYSEFAGLPNIELRSPIYDPLKVEALRRKCKVYLHGHSAGGTNPSLVEAMRSGVPVIAKDVSFNKTTMDSEGIYFSNKDDLREKLQTLDATCLNAMGQKLKQIAKEKYQWSLVAKQYSQVF